MAHSKKMLSEHIAVGQANFIRSTPALIRRMTIYAVKYFKQENFRNQGKDVNPAGRWAPRKKFKKTRRPVLISEGYGAQSGKMRRSIIGKARGVEGVVSSNVSYMQYHQKGTPKMVQRKVLGQSPVLDKVFDKMILKQIVKSYEKAL